MSFDFDPAVEARRSRAIAALGLTDLPPEAEFDALAALAARLLDCPIGMVTLIEQDRQSITAASGTTLRETARRDAFCDVTIRGAGPLVVPDASVDARFAESSLVAGSTGLRAYAGIPILAADPESGERVPVGAVCGLDTRPRQFTQEQQAVLGHLKALAEALFDARALHVRAESQSEALRRSDRTFRQAERMAEMGSWRLELESESLLWSDGVYRIYDIAPGTPPPLSGAMDYFPEHARGIVAGALAQTMETGAPFDIEVDFVSAAGNRRRVRSMGELELHGGRAVAVVGVFQDVTARHALERHLRRSASIDELTRIANRAAFNAELERWAATAAIEGTPLELVLVDLDHFKQINDRHGHLVGDEVLRAFGRRLRRVHATDAFAARVGGDEFALILRDDAARQAPDLIARLLVELRMPVHSSAGVIAASGTIGHASFDPEEEGLHPFVHRADTALYEAKRAQRGTARAWGHLRTGDRRQPSRAA